MQTKEPTVKIISFEVKDNNVMYGLGDDSKIYVWDYHKGEFKLYAKGE